MMFGSAYVCKQAFSNMKKLIPTPMTLITDDHLHHMFRACECNFENNYVNRKNSEQYPTAKITLSVQTVVIFLFSNL